MAAAADALPTDHALWWFMLATGVGAATLSIAASLLDRSGSLSPRLRFWIHMAAYGLMTVSILTFIARGLLLP